MTDVGMRIGDRAEDGWIYAGLSEDTGRPMFVSPGEAGPLSWHDAGKVAEDLQKQGKTNARLPSRGELRQMFNARARIEGMDRSPFCADSRTWLWSSTDAGKNQASLIHLRDGETAIATKATVFPSARFVRD